MALYTARSIPEIEERKFPFIFCTYWKEDFEVNKMVDHTWMLFKLASIVRNVLYYMYMAPGPPSAWGLTRPIGHVTAGGGYGFLGFPYAIAPDRQEPPCPQAAPPPPTPNNEDKGKGKVKGKEKDKNTGSGTNSGNNSRGTLAWLSFYNPWTDTISMCPGMRPSQQ
jgi:hypothetical protein